jgi:hypothetical protein
VIAAILAGAFVSGATILTAAPAFANAVTYSGVTNGFSDIIPIRSCFDTTTDIRFYVSAQQFTVGTTGDYVLANVTNTYHADNDPNLPTGVRMFLYQNSFDPSDPLTNCVDTTSGQLPPTSITDTLTAGTTYFLVTSAYASFEAGDNSFTNEISGPGTIAGSGLTLIASATTTVVASSTNPVATHQQVTFTSTTTPAPDSGTVAFTDGGTTITGCSAKAVNTTTGTATCAVTYPGTGVGSHTIVATYSGDAGFLTSHTANFSQNVVAAVDHLVVAPASASIAAGGTKTFTADARDEFNNDLGDVTSTTTFTISGGGSCTGATCTATRAGTDTVTATKGSATGTASLTVTTATLDHLALSPASTSIAAGGAQSFTAQGLDQYGNSLGDVTAATTFTIAGGGSCTAASCTSSAAGAHTVTGTDGGKTGTATVSVTAAALDHLVLSPATSSIAAGGTKTYTAQGFDQYGNSRGDVTAATTFTITGQGSCNAANCTATAVGTDTVTGTDGGKTGTATLTVTPSGLDHLVLAPASASIVAGNAKAYTAEGFDAYGNSLGDVTAATTFTVTHGTCTGATCGGTLAGTDTVTGTDAGKTGTATLTVTPAALDHLGLSPASASIAAGAAKSYTAEGFDQYGNSRGDVTAATAFTITGQGSCNVATCTDTTAESDTVTGTDNGKAGAATLTVTAAALDYLVLSPSSAGITAGGTQPYTAEGFDQYGNFRGDVTAATTFTITGGGSCTGAACTDTTAGTDTVTGTDGGKTGTATLTVSPATLDHLALSPANAAVTAGDSQTYSAVAFDQFGNSLGDVTGVTTFAIIDGTCTSAKCGATIAGTDTVTGTDGAATGGATLTVNPAPLDHLALSPVSATITAGGSQAYTAEGFDQYGNSRGDVTAATTFTIAGVGSCTGASCTSTAGGPHTVVGTDAAKTGAATLTVAPAAFDHLALAPASATVIAGTAQSYSAEGFDQYGNSRGSVTTTTTFTVNGGGSCVGNSCAAPPGLHTVTGTLSGRSATATLTVIKATPVVSVHASPASAAFGAAVTFTAHVTSGSGGALTPTGSVRFYLNGLTTPLTTVSLVSGTASFVTTGLGAGANSVIASYAGDGNFVSVTSLPAAATVTATTITGTLHGTIKVGAGQIVVLRGATVSGSVQVLAGGRLDVENSTITDSIKATGAAAVRVCGSSVGSGQVSGSTGPVVIGDAAEGCAVNTFRTTLVLTSNTHGLQVIGNRVLLIAALGNSGAGPFPDDTAPRIIGNHA